MNEATAAWPIEKHIEDKQATSERLADYCEQTLEALLPDRDHQLIAVRLLGQYPKEAYHQAAHGLDVMRATKWLLDRAGAPQLQDKNEWPVLLLAAAAHDAGLYTAEAAQHETNEIYAAGQLWNEGGMVLDSDQLLVATEAILGTIMDPEKQRRDTARAKLLHHADLGYIWSCDEAQFTQYALRFRHEECDHLSWREFQELEAKFLDAYAIALEWDMHALQVSRATIQAMVARVQRNRQYITRPNLEEPALETEWPGVAQMIQ